MPKYRFASKDPKDKKILEVECRISELDKIIEDNPDWQLIPTAPSIVSGVISSKNKPDQWFTDRLKTIQKKLPERMKGNINTWR